MDVPSYKSWFPRFTISLVWACDGCSKKGIVCPNNPHFSWTLFRFWSSVFKKIVFKKIFVEFLLENHNPKYLCSFGHPKMYVRRFFWKISTQFWMRFFTHILHCFYTTFCTFIYLFFATAQFANCFATQTQVKNTFLYCLYIYIILYNHYLCINQKSNSCHI